VVLFSDGFSTEQRAELGCLISQQSWGLCVYETTRLQNLTTYGSDGFDVLLAESICCSVQKCSLGKFWLYYSFVCFMFRRRLTGVQTEPDWQPNLIFKLAHKQPFNNSSPSPVLLACWAAGMVGICFELMSCVHYPL